MNLAHDEKDAKGGLAQECVDYATSLRSTANVIRMEGRPAPASFLRAAELFERAATGLREAEAERRELLARQVPQWLPIDSAPKDRTELLLWREDCGQFIGSYTRPEAFPLIQEEIEATDEGSLYAEDWFAQWPQAIRCDGSEAPTHWMPLPAPPTSTLADHYSKPDRAPGEDGYRYG